MFDEVPQHELIDRVLMLDETEILVLSLKCEGYSNKRMVDEQRVQYAKSSIDHIQTEAYKKLGLDAINDPLQKNKVFSNVFCPIIKAIIKTPEDIITYQDLRKDYWERKKASVSKMFEPPPEPETIRRRRWRRPILITGGLIIAVAVICFLLIPPAPPQESIEFTPDTTVFALQTFISGAETQKAQWTPTPEPTPTPPPTSEPIFFEDFGPDMNSYWNLYYGKAIISDGYLQSDYPYTEGDTCTEVTYEDFNLKNYRLYVKYKLDPEYYFGIGLQAQKGIQFPQFNCSNTLGCWWASTAGYGSPDIKQPIRGLNLPQEGIELTLNEGVATAKMEGGDSTLPGLDTSVSEGMLEFYLCYGTYIDSVTISPLP